MNLRLSRERQPRAATPIRWVHQTVAQAVYEHRPCGLHAHLLYHGDGRGGARRTSSRPCADRQPQPRRTADLSKLSAEQRALVARAMKAAAMAREATATHQAALAERDQLVRDLLGAEVGVTLIGRELGMNRAMVWKIARGVTTADLDRARRERERP